MSQYIAGWYSNFSYTKNHPLHIDNYTQIEKFNGDLNNNITIDYVMGIFDSIGKINVSNQSCTMCVKNNNELLHKLETYIKDKLQIPYKLVDNDTIVFQQSNAVDFLGKLYQEILEKNYTDPVNVQNFKQLLACDTPTLVIKKCNPDAITPTKAMFSDAGIDVSIISMQKIIKENVYMFNTGIKLDIPVGYYVEIVPRSSITKTGYLLANNIGIIDCSYKGELKICLAKISNSAPVIQFPLKCCQLIMRKQVFPMIKITTTNDDELDDVQTKRQSGGFGSTDNK